MDMEIETRWWILMDKALEKKLCLKLEKHINSKNRTVLLIQIAPIDRKPEILFKSFDNDYRTELFFKAEKFIKEYEG